MPTKQLAVFLIIWLTCMICHATIITLIIALQTQMERMFTLRGMIVLYMLKQLTPMQAWSAKDVKVRDVKFIRKNNFYTYIIILKCSSKPITFNQIQIISVKLFCLQFAPITWSTWIFVSNGLKCVQRVHFCKKNVPEHAERANQV